MPARAAENCAILTKYATRLIRITADPVTEFTILPAAPPTPIALCARSALSYFRRKDSGRLNRRSYAAFWHS